MTFEIEKSIEILSRTPLVLESLLNGLSAEWVNNNEGENTWSPYEVLGHLIHGEKTDWLQRTKIILSNSEHKTFEPFDRFAQLKEDNTRPIEELLEEFSAIRLENLKELKSLQINDSKLQQKGVHPALGEVNLKELLSTWVVHDLGHISQITRVMAKQYQSEVGPWIEYLGILKK
ncbi:DinB family protein [Flexithrix dorotheae]|uniref:DinB family protein n=1 Tax=Flexithrix dorotheae TaxID=70993 RepID=UPI00037B38DE|nr:DinB family protein [Flexithrix dorotheae]